MECRQCLSISQPVAVVIATVVTHCCTTIRPPAVRLHHCYGQHQWRGRPTLFGLRRWSGARTAGLPLYRVPSCYCDVPRPQKDLQQKAEQGLLVLGGCCPLPARWHCNVWTSAVRMSSRRRGRGRGRSSTPAVPWARGFHPPGPEAVATAPGPAAPAASTARPEQWFQPLPRPTCREDWLALNKEPGQVCSK